MIRFTHGRLVTAMAAALLLALPVAPASAGPQKPPDRWIAAPCADGAITGGTPGISPGGGMLLNFDGWVQPCVEVPGGTFAFVLYTAASGYRGRLRDYAPNAAAVPFGGVLEYARYRHLGTPKAICVSRDWGTRVACGALRATNGSGGDPLVRPIPIDDPLVTRPEVEISQAPGQDLNPNCGTCL
jgi:hypothetical protein